MHGYENSKVQLWFFKDSGDSIFKRIAIVTKMLLTNSEFDTCQFESKSDSWLKVRFWNHKNLFEYTAAPGNSSGAMHEL